MDLGRYFALAFFCLSALGLRAQEQTDSVASSHELEEVVVVGERAWIEGNKAVFVPTKSEKNLADSPQTLVERMNIPLVIVDGGVIKNLRGQGVPVYINGEPATDIDLQTFWPKQTYRVEYIDHPTDPKYRGADAVLNFIMTEYVVGGVTKVRGMQYIPNSGRYNLSSKLVYKKMTFGALVGGEYRRDHSSSYTGEENYNGLWYDGEWYDNIKRTFSGHSWSRSENLDVSLNARFATENVRITHTAGLKWIHNPGSGSESTDEWSPSLFDSNHTYETNRSRSFSPQLSGDYAYWNAKIGISGGWAYSHSHNNTASMSQFGSLTPIANSTREDVNSAKANFTGSYLLKPRMALWLKLNTSMDWFTTRYMGTANQTQRQWRGGSDASLSFRWQPCDKFYVTADPGIIVDYWHLYDRETHYHVSPKAEVNLMYAPGRKFNISGFVAYFNRAPSAAQSGDVIIRQDELNWLSSSPNLKNTSTWMSNLNFTWIPLQEFNMSTILTYIRGENEFIYTYKVADKDMGGLIKTYTNASPDDIYALDLFLNGKLFDNKLSLQLQPVFHYMRQHGEYATDMFWFRMRGVAIYTMGNFSVSAVYGGPQKGTSQGGMTRGWTQESVGVSAAYGNGDVHVSVGVDNIFHTHSKKWSKTQAGVYDYMNQSYNRGRSFNISVNYTFGYGKKVDRNIEISGPSEGKSGALGSE